MEKNSRNDAYIVAVSGGPDSVYLVHWLAERSAIGRRITYVIGHFNHAARGRQSDDDMRFVERTARQLGNLMEVQRMSPKRGCENGRELLGDCRSAGFEASARVLRYAFLRDLKKKYGAEKILLGHTADDQVETVLMRILEGAGISGLKGIPRRTADGIERPLLDTWRDDIIQYLRRHKIPFRTDKSNFDTRFERNWIRHVLIPLLERRYGKSVKKRIFSLGERFRELDAFLDAAVRRWLKRNVKPESRDGSKFSLPRPTYAKRPCVVRKRIVQILFFERLGIAPNERLIELVDKVLVSGKPSARLNLGRGATVTCRYGEAVFRPGEGREAPATPAGDSRVPGTLVVREAAGKPAAAHLRRRTSGEREAVFDADGISGPFSVRPLRAGDRIRPFGAPGTRKIKEILIDRKVPREERWGRPVVCDGRGEIVWVPGLVRSCVAPVTPETRRTVVLAIRKARSDMKGCSAGARVLR